MSAIPREPDPGPAVSGEPQASGGPPGAAGTSGSTRAALAGAERASEAATDAAAERAIPSETMPSEDATSSATETAAGGESAVATASRDPGAGAAPPDPTDEKRGKKRRGGTAPGASVGPRRSRTNAPGKRERILRAAAELFASKDYHRVLIDEVARRAEVGKGTVYRYFQTKEDLFVAVLSYAVDLATERLRAKIERASDPVEQLRVACKQAVRFFRENGHLFHVLNHAKALRCARGRKDLNEKREALRHFVEDILVDGREDGVFDLADAAFASTILWGMIRTALRTSSTDAPLDEVSDEIVALFTKGILRRAAGTSGSARAALTGAADRPDP